MVSRLIGGVAELAENTASENGESGEVLGEIVDEPIGTVGQPVVSSRRRRVVQLASAGYSAVASRSGQMAARLTPVASIPSPAPDESTGGDPAPKAAGTDRDDSGHPGASPHRTKSRHRLPHPRRRQVLQRQRSTYATASSGSDPAGRSRLAISS